MYQHSWTTLHRHRQVYTPTHTRTHTHTHTHIYTHTTRTRARAHTHTHTHTHTSVRTQTLYRLLRRRTMILGWNAQRREMSRVCFWRKGENLSVWHLGGGCSRYKDWNRRTSESHEFCGWSVGVLVCVCLMKSGESRKGCTTAVDILYSTLNPANHAANKNQAWRVECGHKTRRSPVSAARNRERRCTMQDCQNFSCGRAYSFVNSHDYIFIRFHGEHMFAPFSQVSSDRAYETRKHSGERKWIFNQSTLALE